ncbi:MAG: YebC/PmpR family DNA-binding transcriptional regulator [Planctomycetota bacterium]|nr:YebC/PmpR family DNA-binding transcriptional regulator [Planctomycetota bacterium]MDI6787527.1 YebC/PmpR family DNA-binding transcriptional regulator [Planctomycetota bacterium]
MSGHSHWSSIRHKKGAADAKKGKEFSKMARLLMIATRDGGSDPKTNVKLQYAIEKARSVNMPNDNIERAIKKGAGELGTAKMETVVYEGYGPGGAAVMVETLTDNRNRTASEIRKIFELNNSKLGEANSVNWFFERKGVIHIPAESVNEDLLLGEALDSGAEDVRLEDDVFEVITDPKDTEKVKDTLKQKGFNYKIVEITFIPKTYITLNKTEGGKIIKLMEILEDNDDVQNVYSNFDIPEE